MSEKFNKLAARQAFNDTIELTARLASFATSRTKEIFGQTNIHEYAIELALRDMVLLSLSVRRIIELASIHSLAKCEFIPRFLPDARVRQGKFPIGAAEAGVETEKITLWELIGIIIHHQNFSIYTNDAKMHLTFMPHQLDAYEIYKFLIAGTPIDAQCLVKSDRSQRLLFRMTDYLKCVAKIIKVAENEFGDLGVYVGNFRDDV